MSWICVDFGSMLHDQRSDLPILISRSHGHRTNKYKFDSRALKGTPRTRDQYAIRVASRSHAVYLAGSGSAHQVAGLTSILETKTSRAASCPQAVTLAGFGPAHSGEYHVVFPYFVDASSISALY